jgi:hypothetical protein
MTGGRYMTLDSPLSLLQYMHTRAEVVRVGAHNVAPAANHMNSKGPPMIATLSLTGCAGEGPGLGTARPWH